MNLVFLTDDPLTFAIAKDTSFALMLAAQRMGHSIFIVQRGDITLGPGGILFHCRETRVQDLPDNPFEFSEFMILPASRVNIVFIRTDPPFGSEYLQDTWLLSLLPDQVKVINAPAGIREVNEKIWATRFREIIPETIITNRMADFTEFLSRHKTIIIKPANGYGGSSVFLCKKGDLNAVVMFETVLTISGYVILQQYLESAKDGDKRILLLGGEPLGAILRLHAEHDHRNNFMAGGTSLPAKISQNDLAIISQLKPFLIKLGLHFTGIDIIGGKLIEINVTSPTCIREMEKEYGSDLSGKVIDYAVNL